MRVVLLGPPGAGKGTQAQFLTIRLGIPKISTGDMLRAAADRGTELGREAKVFTDQGLLVPDEMILRLVDDRLDDADVREGYLLDGFPRTVNQAVEFEQWLMAHDQTLDAVVDIRVPEAKIVARISDRRVCPACHETYHLTSRPPKIDQTCDICGHALVQRDDDRAELVLDRLQVYRERTEPVLAYYNGQGLLVPVDGDRPAGEVTAAIVAAVTPPGGPKAGA